MIFKLNLKIFILFILFFVLTFFEDRFIGGLSFASIWKIPFILYWIYYTFILYAYKSAQFSFIMFLGVFCLLMPFHSNMANSLLPEITDGLKYIIVPSLFFYLIRRYKNKPFRILKLLFWLSAFLIWTNVPYLLKIIEPKVQKDYSYAFGDDMLDMAGFSGAYMNIHSQAVYMSCALLLIIFLIYKFPKRFSWKNWFLILTILIGVYCLYLSFARTGWIFFVVGIVIIFSDNFKWKHIRRSIPLILLFIVSLSYLYTTNTSLRKRLTDDRENTVTGGLVRQAGSGRLVYSMTALENWSESKDLFTLLFGYGSEKGKEKMESKIGVHLFAHNGYIEILQRSGLVGVILFFIFLYKFYLFNKSFNNVFSSLTMAFFFGWLIVGAVQEFTFVYFNIMISGVMAVAFLINRNSKMSTD